MYMKKGFGNIMAFVPLGQGRGGALLLSFKPTERELVIHIKKA
jgi:hypothetical protein